MSFLDAKRMKELEARVEELEKAVGTLIRIDERFVTTSAWTPEGPPKRKPGRPRKDQTIIGAG